MPATANTAKNQEIVNKFLASKAFDFQAFGKFVAENGASLAGSADGEFGFVIGNHFIRYCIPPVTSVFNEGINPARLGGEVSGGD